MRSLLSLLLLLGATALQAAEPHPSLPPPVIPECLGVQIDFTEPKPGELQMLAAAGFRWVRLDLSWAATERKKGEYDFSAYDRLAAALAQFQLRAVFVLKDGNPLYADPGDTPPFDSREATADFRNAFAAWTVAAMGHFRGRGYLWEMGNEFNRQTFRHGRSDVPGYIARATATGEALRTAGLLGPQGEAFIGPATGGVDLSFLEACFKKGLLGYWDAVSVHPTRNDAPETVEKDLRQLRLLIRKYAPVEKVIPVISSGWGYSSTSPALGHDDFARRETQSRYLAREFLAGLANDVALSIWADWRDDATNPTPAERGHGLIEHEYQPNRTSAFQPKPAYAAMQTLAREFAGFRFNKRLHSWDSEDDYLLLFEKHGDIRAAAWTIRQKPIKIAIPASPGDVTITNAEGRMIMLDTKDAVRNDFGLKFTPSALPVYCRFAPPNYLLCTAATASRLPLEYVFSIPGTSAPLRFVYKNCSGQIVTTRITSRDERADEKWTILDDRKDTRLVAGGGWGDTLIAAQSFSQNSPTSALLLGIEVRPADQADDDRVIPIVQRVSLIPSNPLTITRMPAQPDEVLVRIENLDHALWQGQAMVNGPVGEWRGKGRSGVLSETIPLTLPPDSPSLLVHLPRMNVEKETWWQGIGALTLISPNGQRADFPITDDRFFELDLPNVQVVPDGDPKVKVESTHDATLPPDGPLLENLTALHIQYDFSAGWRCLKVINPTWPPASEKNLIGRPKAFGVWIHGDARGCVAHMRFVDASNQFFQTSGVKVDWTGWRHVTFPMEHQEDKKLEYWSGADDGEIHYPIDLDSVLVLDNEARKPVKGEIYISGPSLIF